MPAERGGIVEAISGEQLPHWIIWSYSQIELGLPPCDTEEPEWLCRLSQKTCLEGLCIVRSLPPLNTPACSLPSHQAKVRAWVGRCVGPHFVGHNLVNQEKSALALTSFFSWHFGGSFTLPRVYCLAISTSLLKSRDLWRDRPVVPTYVL